MRERNRRVENREMRSRSSKQGNNKGLMEIAKLNKLKEEPHLSGAYIRSLVKQLTSSRTKDPMNPTRNPDGVADGDGFSQNLTKFSEEEIQETHEPQPPQQPKKQVRRRLHTSRPYQERLLNMAEARREIVTALKFHRAAMKQANEQQQQQQQQPQPPPPQPSLEQQEKMMKSHRNPRIYPSNPNNVSNYVDNLPSYSSFSYHPPFLSPPPPPPPPPPVDPFSWPYSPIAPLPIAENLNNLTLPNQSLGLNLNFQDFNNLDATLYHSSSNNPSIYSSTSPSSSSSHTVSSSTEAIIPPVMVSPEEIPVTESGVGSEVLHPAMDDDAMAEIRSIGEQHQMEWNDTLNLVTSAWWFKFLKATQISPEERGGGEDNNGYHPFDEFLDFPAWLNANESCLVQQHLNDYCSDDYLKDPDLQCMDIGEIEAMDGEWLA